MEQPLTKPLLERLPDGSRNPLDRYILSKTPAKRWGKPEDLVGPAVFLVSDAADFVSGQILYVDGGLLATVGKNPKRTVKGSHDDPLSAPLHPILRLRQN